MSMMTTSVPTVADAIEQTLEWLDTHGSARIPNGATPGVIGIAYRRRIKYMPAGTVDEEAFDVMTRNLSRTGLSFIHKTLIYPRQRVTVELPLPDHSVRNLKARVVRIRSAGAGLYEIGVEFTELEVAVV